MITMIQGWKGAVEINGKQYETVERAVSDFKPVNGVISIKLYPKQLESQNKAAGAVYAGNRTESVADVKEYQITVKKYMTEKASPEFDFMAKWNNDNPMPLRTMTGIVLQETKGMVKMRLHGVGRAEVTCMRCGRSLTNPVSRHYGIGPECMQKIGFVGVDIEDIALIKEKLQELTWEGWIIKSAITDREEVL